MTLVDKEHLANWIDISAHSRDSEATRVLLCFAIERGLTIDTTGKLATRLKILAVDEGLQDVLSKTRPVQPGVGEAYNKLSAAFDELEQALSRFVQPYPKKPGGASWFVIKLWIARQAALAKLAVDMAAGRENAVATFEESVKQSFVPPEGLSQDDATQMEEVRGELLVLATAEAVDLVSVRRLLEANLAKEAREITDFLGLVERSMCGPPVLARAASGEGHGAAGGASSGGGLIATDKAMHLLAGSAPSAGLPLASHWRPGAAHGSGADDFEEEPSSDGKGKRKRTDEMPPLPLVDAAGAPLTPETARQLQLSSQRLRLEAARAAGVDPLSEALAEGAGAPTETAAMRRKRLRPDGASGPGEEMDSDTEGGGRGAVGAAAAAPQFERHEPPLRTPSWLTAPPGLGVQIQFDTQPEDELESPQPTRRPELSPPASLPMVMPLNGAGAAVGDGTVRTHGNGHGGGSGSSGGGVAAPINNARNVPFTSGRGRAGGGGGSGGGDGDEEQPQKKQRPLAGQGRRRAIRWTDEEINELRRGVFDPDCGLGYWAEIRRKYNFNDCRTNVDLKDKWRGLKRAGKDGPPEEGDGGPAGRAAAAGNGGGGSGVAAAVAGGAGGGDVLAPAHGGAAAAVDMVGGSLAAAGGGGIPIHEGHHGGAAAADDDGGDAEVDIGGAVATHDGGAAEAAAAAAHMLGGGATSGFGSV